MTKGVMIQIIVAALALVQYVTAHAYHSGACPLVDHMEAFQMNRFLGPWYIIQRTSTGSGCLVNNFTVDHESGGYLLEERSRRVLGLTSVDHTCRYIGRLAVPDLNSPANMKVKFPLSVAGSASFIVFDTDYENYAGVFTCQKVSFANRQAASILSRKHTLDKQYIDKIRNKLSSYGIDPFELSIIDHRNCPVEEGHNITINPDIFSASNIAGVVRTAGEKLGDEVETLVRGAETVYFTLHKNHDSEEMSNSNTSGDTK